MGLTRIEIDFYGRLLSAGLLGKGGDILEFGESQVFEEPLLLIERLKDFIGLQQFESGVRAIDIAANSVSEYQRQYGPARALYEAIFCPNHYTSMNVFGAADAVGRFELSVAIEASV